MAKKSNAKRHLAASVTKTTHKRVEQYQKETGVNFSTAVETLLLEALDGEPPDITNAHCAHCDRYWYSKMTKPRCSQCHRTAEKT